MNEKEKQLYSETYCLVRFTNDAINALRGGLNCLNVFKGLNCQNEFFIDDEEEIFSIIDAAREWRMSIEEAIYRLEILRAKFETRLAEIASGEIRMY